MIIVFLYLMLVAFWDLGAMLRTDFFSDPTTQLPEYKAAVGSSGAFHSSKKGACCSKCSCELLWLPIDCKKMDWLGSAF